MKLTSEEVFNAAMSLPEGRNKIGKLFYVHS